VPGPCIAGLEKREPSYVGPKASARPGKFIGVGGFNVVVIEGCR